MSKRLTTVHGFGLRYLAVFAEHSKHSNSSITAIPDSDDGYNNKGAWFSYLTDDDGTITKIY